MRHGYCLQGPVRVELSVLQKAQGKTVISPGAIWNFHGHCKIESQIAGAKVSFLSTVLGWGMLEPGVARLFMGLCSWQALTHVLTLESGVPAHTHWCFLAFTWAVRTTVLSQQDLSSFEPLWRLPSSWCPSIRSSCLLGKKSGPRNDKEDTFRNSSNGWLCVSVSEKASFPSDLHLSRDRAWDILSLEGWHYQIVIVARNER